MTIDTSTPLQITIHPKASDAGGQGQFWSEGAPSFKDVLDTINPLQHIPIISTIYQSLTGDVPSSGANLAGGALIGGPIGFVAALFNEIVKTQSGKDISGNIMASLSGNNDTAPTPQTTALAANEVPFMSPNQRSSYNAYTRTSA